MQTVKNPNATERAGIARKISAVAVALLTLLVIGGCAFNIKNTEVLTRNDLNQRTMISFSPPIVVNWGGRKNQWRIETKKDVLPVDTEINNNLFIKVRNRLREQGVKITEEGNSIAIVKATLYSSYDYGLHHDLLDGIRLLEGRVVLEKDGSVVMRTYASWNGAIGADYNRGVESVSEELVGEILLWINDR